LCLNTNSRTGCWRSNTKTTKTEILLFLNLEFFCVFVCLLVLFPVCPSLPDDFNVFVVVVVVSFTTFS
jgi:hypothetical protein